MKLLITEKQFYNIGKLLNESYLNGVDDNEIVAATLVGEAGGEGTKGMEAVYGVLSNRAKNKGTSTAGESLRPRQFSMWDSVTRNVSSKEDFNKKSILSIIKSYKSHPKWNEAVTISKSSIKDPTKGATHYYAFKGPYKINPPFFTNNWTETVEIGNHKFGIV